MENQLKQPPTLSSKDSPQRSMGFSKGCGYCTLCKCMQSKLGWPLCLVTEQAPLRCLPGDIVASIFRVCWSRMCLCRALLWGWAFKHFGHSILACRAALEFPELFFLSLFSDQWKRHVDLGVSVEMYSHCIFHLTNLKTVSAVPVALVFKSPSCCWRALQHALQHHFICKDQNNGEKSLNSQMLHCFSFHHVFSFKFGQYGFTR